MRLCLSLVSINISIISCYSILHIVDFKRNLLTNVHAQSGNILLEWSQALKLRAKLYHQMNRIPYVLAYQPTPTFEN